MPDNLDRTEQNRSLTDKRQHYKQEIDNIAKESFNEEQKEIARFILDRADEGNIDAVYSFITQRVKLGFVFDTAPETRHDCVALCEYNNSLRFGGIAPTENNHKFIIGENYDALKNLVCTYTRNGEGLIDVIYIDPPYNTEHAKKDGNDYKEEVKAEKFIYRDKFTRTGWLNMMRERLVLARKLLSPKGVIFISIDDREQAYLKVLCDEIFGENNFVCNIIWQKKKGGSQDSETFSREHEYILCYQKKEWQIVEVVEDFEKNSFSKIINGKNAKIMKLEKWGNHSLRTDRPTLYYPIKDPNGNDFYPMAPNGEDGCWRKKPENLDCEHIFWQKNKKGRLIPYEVIYYDEMKDKEKIVKTRTIFTDYGTTTDATKDLLLLFNNHKVFDTPKPVSLMKKIISLSTYNKSAIVLDFFAGSGTTGQAVMELNEEDGGNRRCILVTNNENGIAQNVAYERLYRVVMGKGTKGEKFQWQYSKEKPCLTNNYWDVFEIRQYELKIDDYEKAQELIKKAENEFKLLNSYYEHKEFDIYNQLASLRPFRTEDK